ncbi:MAG: hypothetical protein J1G02_02945 [Clostridiales bacterium]|nr:hypothetical protein [Clostridiales bacterium]
MKKTTTIILVSVLTLAFCCSLLIGTTYAIFSNEKDSKLEVTTGTIVASATVVGMSYLAYESPGENDYPHSEPAYTFGYATFLDEGYGIVNMSQGCSVVAEIQVRNTGSIPARLQLKVAFVSDEADQKGSDDDTHGGVFSYLIATHVELDENFEYKEVVSQFVKSDDGNSAVNTKWFDIGAKRQETMRVRFEMKYTDDPLATRVYRSGAIVASVEQQVSQNTSGDPSVPTADSNGAEGGLNALADYVALPFTFEDRKFGI